MERNNTLWAAVAGFGAGAGLMYLLDPDRGARRRAILSDKVSSIANDTPDALSKTSRDLTNRAQGVWARVSSSLTGGSEDMPDQKLEARVRSAFGRVVSHPRAIHVAADAGTVRLTGNILENEVDALLGCVEGVSGVQTVENMLTPHKTAGNIPDLQGGRGRREPRAMFFQENWSPAERVLAGTAGGLLLAYGVTRENPLFWGLGALGAGLLARSISNVETKRLLGTGGGRRAVDVQKSINVDAPPDILWGLWSNFENFPKFMTNVKEVKVTGAGNSHWVVAGPAGASVEWDAEITRVEPNKLIAWKSVEGSTIPNAGIVRFDENDDGTTTVNVRISYNPPAGAIGHAVATIFGADPKSQMDADLMRMKTLLETGEAPHDAAQPPRGKSAVAGDDNAQQETIQ